jgi:hypothetical protein
MAVLPVRWDQIDLGFNGVFKLGDNTQPNGVVLELAKGADGKGGIFRLPQVLEFRDGLANAGNTISYLGRQLFHGSIFTTEVFERSIEVRHIGNLTSSKLVWKSQNTVKETETPPVGDQTKAWFTANNNILEGSYFLELVDGAVTYRAKDDEAGNLIDNGSTTGYSVSGTINYITGEVHVNFSHVITASAGLIQQKFITQKELFSIENSVDNVVQVHDTGVLKVSVRTDTSISNPQVGMLIFDPLSGTLKVRTVSDWKDVIGGNVKFIRDIFDVTVPTDTFGLSQIPLGNSQAEREAGILVFVNGALVRPGSALESDYQYQMATNSIVFNAPLQVDDELQLIYLTTV